jgi:hypothetical protein
MRSGSFTKETTTMWKIAIGFVAFAALALFVLFKAGDGVDLGGEKHGTEAISPAPAPGK